MSATSASAMVNALPFPAFIEGLDGRLIRCNSLFLAWVGLPAERVLGHRARDIAWAEPAEAAGERLLAGGGGARVFEWQALRADGERRELELHKSVLVEPSGAVTGLLCILTDVTERKRTERALVESEARFFEFVALTREGVLIHRNGRIQDANGALCRMAGRPRDELLGRAYEVLLAPEFVEEARRHVSGRSSDAYRAGFLRPDGRVVPVEVRGLNLSHGGDDIRVAAVRDITEQLAAEAAQKEREQLYRQMFETNCAIKLLLDPSDGRIVDANFAAERFYGWPLGVLKSMRITEINPSPPERVRADMAEATREERLFFRVRHRLASGELRDVEVYSGPVTYEGSDLLHAIIHDVTDRTRYQKELELKTVQLERSNSELEQFASVVSHDLQEPLRTVSSYLQLIERRYKESLAPDAAEFIGFAVQGAKRMARMIQDLLAYARVDASARQLDAVDLNRVVGVVRENLRFAVDEAGADIRVGPLPVVKGEANQLSSLLQNLLGNALKYRHPDRRPVVEVSARAIGSEWELSVTDNGIGIAPAYHAQVFMIFKRLHDAGQYDGTGIGLAICKRIVTRHGGRIWVESAEGQGATFRFTLLAAETRGGPGLLPGA